MATISDEKASTRAGRTMPSGNLRHSCSGRLLTGHGRQVRPRDGAFSSCRFVNDDLAFAEYGRR